MAGYLEGLGSERGIAWRCADSISLGEFLGCGLANTPPEHSTLSNTRKRLGLEANAAMRTIVRREDGTGYEEFLEKLAKASGIETPTREDLAKLDRKRPNKASNNLGLLMRKLYRVGTPRALPGARDPCRLRSQTGPRSPFRPILRPFRPRTGLPGPSGPLLPVSADSSGRNDRRRHPGPSPAKAAAAPR